MYTLRFCLSGNAVNASQFAQLGGVVPCGLLQLEGNAIEGLSLGARAWNNKKWGYMKKQHLSRTFLLAL
ncbi:MAG: hypothetical protein V4805_15540 [Pseudomonadota bacterium]